MAGKVGHLSAVLLLFCFGMAMWQTEACSCGYATFYSHYCGAYFVVRATRTGSYTPSSGSYKYYYVKITTSFKGPGVAGQYKWIRTQKSSAACGVTLGNGVSYILMGNLSGGYWNINSCGYIKTWSGTPQSLPCYYKVKLYENSIYCLSVDVPDILTG